MQLTAIFIVVGTNVGDISIWEVGSRERLALKTFKVWDISACSMPFQVSANTWIMCLGFMIESCPLFSELKFSLFLKESLINSTDLFRQPWLKMPPYLSTDVLGARMDLYLVQ